MLSRDLCLQGQDTGSSAPVGANLPAHPGQGLSPSLLYLGSSNQECSMVPLPAIWSETMDLSLCLFIYKIYKTLEGLNRMKFNVQKMPPRCSMCWFPHYLEFHKQKTVVEII